MVETDPEKIVELVARWNSLLLRQEEARRERGDFVGILVAKDDCALGYQELQREIYRIRNGLFGVHGWHT